MLVFDGWDDLVPVGMSGVRTTVLCDLAGEVSQHWNLVR